MHVISFPSFSPCLHIIVCSNESLSTLRQTPSTPKINAVSTIFACLVHFVVEWSTYIRTVAGNHQMIVQCKEKLNRPLLCGINLIFHKTSDAHWIFKARKSWTQKCCEWNRMKKNNKSWDGYQHAATSKQCWTLWSECPEQRSGRYVIDVIAQGKSTCTKAEANQNSLHGDQIQNLQIGEDSGSHASCCLFPLLYSFAWECLDHNRKKLKACRKVCINTCEQTLSQTTTRLDTAKGLAPPAGLGQTATPWFICEFDEQTECANILWC